LGVCWGMRRRQTQYITNTTAKCVIESGEKGVILGDSGAVLGRIMCGVLPDTPQKRKTQSNQAFRRPVPWHDPCSNASKQKLQ
jgi:hypothetical protein